MRTEIYRRFIKAKVPKRLQEVRDGEGKMTEYLIIMYHQTDIVV